MHYLSPIDPHVHLRGTEYATDFMKLGMEDCRAVGMDAVIEMPNCTPWLTCPAAIDARILLGMRESELSVTHRAHIGLTNNLDQVKDVLALITRNFCGLASDKTYYTHSTGNMGILDPDLQKRIWEEKAKMGYRGVSVGHFEDENAFVGTFDPKYPLSHSMVRDPNSETIQVERQLRNAVDAKFRGVFYIAHCSTPETFDLAQGGYPFRVVIELSWHHLLLNTDDYTIHGNRVKMNPPLRTPGMQADLLERLFGTRNIGNVCIGSDHAPHPIEKKDDVENPASGIPAILFYPKGVEILRNYGMRLDAVEAITHYNPARIFGLVNYVRSAAVDFTYQRHLWDRYGFNPFSRIDR